MESLNPNLLASAIAYPKGYFAFTQKGCCGGQAPNFFSSYPNGVQVGALLGLAPPRLEASFAKSVLSVWPAAAYK